MMSVPGDGPAPPAFHVMLKPRGAVCNLSCQYCYYLGKERLYPGNDSRMDDDVLEEFTRQYIEAQRVPEATFSWQGGEPTLMGLDFFERAVALQHKYQKPGMRIYNALQTNAILLDDAWCCFFKERGFLVGVSLDGPQECHDTYRVDKRGRPTFQQVMAGLALLKKHQVEFNILTTVHAANAGQPLQVYQFLRDQAGAQFIQLIPIVEWDNRSPRNSRVTERSVSGRQYGDFLIAVFDEWVRRDVGRIYVQIFDVALGAWLGQPSSLCTMSVTCGQAMAMEHNGDVYACDHFIEPRHRLGNIRDTSLVEMVNSRQQRRFGAAKRDTLPRACQMCEVRFACNGECPKNRFWHTGNEKPGLNVLCEGYKAFFTHIDPAMQFMAAAIRARRPPAEIMGCLAQGNDPTGHGQNGGIRQFRFFD